MEITAVKLRESEKPQRAKLYKVVKSCDILSEEEHDDGSLDQVLLEYRINENDVGYYACEYRPDDVPKSGAKLIDITALILNPVEKCGRWHLYDIKGTLAGEGTVTKLYNQWSSGLRYLQKNILDCIPEYSMTPDLGVIARSYDEERMKRLRNDCRRQCDEMEDFKKNMTLAQQKKRADIAKTRATLKAAQAILDRKFQAENGMDTYEIHIRQLSRENDQLYKMEFSV